jgi:chromosome segregation ATPase
MWKDMLEAESAAREQADEENKKLRDEILRLKSDTFSVPSQRSARRPKPDRLSSAASQSTGSDRGFDRNGLGSGSSSTLVELELLRHENAELRREVGAQTSMLTSRNKEKERLYQEIEDLKLTTRRGDGRSVAGDSIFERSASRAHRRSSSRTSDGTKISNVSDAERENFEIKNGELRDQASALKLENQTLREQLDEVTVELEATDRAYQADVDKATQDIQDLELERNDALRIADEREAEFQSLKAEAQEEIDALGDERDELQDEIQRLESELRNMDENFKALEGEMRSMSEGIIRLEEDSQANLEKFKAVQQELEESNRELENTEKALFESNSKVQRLTVQQESSQNEIAFLREEQDADKIKIGDLESAHKTSQMGLQSEKEKTRELDRRLAEERHQREVVGSKEKQEVQRMMNDLNREATSAKDDARKLKKALASREIEVTTWKERLTDLEEGLRNALGDPGASRATLLGAVIKLQKELDTTTTDLESIRSLLDEKEQALKHRDTLLESHGLESRKLSELLDRERAARRADKHSFEQALKSHQQANRTISQNNSRIVELETARAQDRKKLSNLEQSFKDQLSERNALLLSIWKRLSVMCGPDWAHSNSLINGNLPSQEVVGNMLFWPGFSRNLLLALKTVEGLIGGFKTRIKTVERDLWKEYQSLEHTLDLRIKKMDRLEDTAHTIRAAQTSSPEMTKLKGENRLLKAELNLLHRQELSSRGQNHSHTNSGDSNTSVGIPQRMGSRSSTLNSVAATMMRHHSSSAVEGINASHPPPYNNTNMNIQQSTSLSRSNSITSHQQTLSQGSNPPAPIPAETGQEKWIHRLRELERRLKAEREARLLDRSGARKRLEEEGLKNEELRRELERERMRGSESVVGSTSGGTVDGGE